MGISPTTALVSARQRHSPGVPAGIWAKADQAALVVLLILSSIGLNPPAIFGESTVGGGAAGDLSRQGVFISLFVIVCGLGVVQRGARSLFTIPIPILAVIAWLGLSLLWAQAPDVALRRVLFATIVMLSVVYIIKALPYRTAIETLTMACGAIIFCDWIASLTLPFALHQASDSNSTLVGDWRGLHSHKNEAGAFCVFSLLLLIHEIGRTKAFIVGSLMCLAVASFLVMTSSKTSIGFIFVALIAGGMSERSFANPLLRKVIVAVTVVISLTFTCIYVAEIGDYWHRLMDDPSSLTGRVQIWSALYLYLQDHPFLGSGYGSFWTIGDSSPVFNYAPGWITTINHAHNGYLNVTIQLGYIGAFIVLGGLILYPLYLCFCRPLPAYVSRALLCSMIVFGLCDNVMESSLLDRANPTWVFMLIAYCLLFEARWPSRTLATRSETSVAM